MQQTIPSNLFSFLTKLRENNTREWMDEHKKEYRDLENKLKSFYSGVENELNKTDQIERTKVFRIHRDVRFSKNKIPYKTNRSVNFIREGAHRRGSYYLQLAPGKSFMAGGFFSPEPADLLRIRKEFKMDADLIRKILEEESFKKAFGGFNTEDQVKTAPRGFSQEDPNIDLIRNKNFFVSHSFSDSEVLHPQFGENLLGYFLLLRPYLDYMSDVLTTDLNGESLI